jgi:RHS repeat-associated protein
LSGSLQAAGGIAALLQETYLTTNSFVAFDGNGNVVSLVNAANGTTAAQYEYGPFAEPLRTTGPMSQANLCRFSTKYQDNETDLAYYGYRYYCPGTATWICRDPFDEGGGINLYAFLDNSPVGQVDLVGTCADCKCKGVDISYKPKLKDGQLSFDFYTGPDKKKRYGVTISIKWEVDGDGSKCSYALNEPSGGVTGSGPNGPAPPSDGTFGLWVQVPQTYNDPVGIRVDAKGQYTINANITQTYACWDSGVNPEKDSPSMTAGPFTYTGSGSKKY